MRRSSPTVGALAALTTAVLMAVVVTTAVGEVDLEVRSGDRAKGTFDPGTQFELYRFRAPAGASLRVKTKGLKGRATTALVGGPNAFLVEGVEKGARATVTAPSLPETAEYLVGVRSRDGTVGDYAFAIRWTTPASARETRTMSAGATETFSFAADLGARVKVEARAGDGSAARPSLVRIAGAGGTTLLAGDGVPATTDLLGSVTLPGTDVYTIDVQNAGDAGPVTVIVKTKAPPRSTRRIDVTSRAIGSSGDDLAIARIVGAAGGVVAVPDLGIGGGTADISGSSVDVPPGALPGLTTIVVGTSPTLDPSGDETPAGPTVSFGPEGTRFAEAATITIPFDLGLAGGDTSAVRIYTRDAEGRVRLVDPPYDFSVPGVVSFPATHFSSFVAAAVAPGGPGGDPLGFGRLLDASPVDVTAASGQGDPSRVLWYAQGVEVFEVLRQPDGTFLSRSWAGGGAQTADGTPKAQFDFGTGVRTVLESGGAVLAATDTQIFTVGITSGTVSLVAGTGVASSTGDGGPAIAATFVKIDDLYVDSNGDLLLVEANSFRLRRIDAGGNIFAFAGDGTFGDGNDGPDPTAIPLRQPQGVTQGTLGGHRFLVESNRIRRVRADTGAIETWAGQQGSTSAPCTATSVAGASAIFSGLRSIAADPDRGVLYVASSDCHVVYRVSETTGAVQVLAGTPPNPGIAGDGASGGSLDTPLGLVSVSAGGASAPKRSIFFADRGNGRIVRFTFTQ